MGAQVGAAYAAGIPLDDVESLWRTSSVGRVARTLCPTIPWSGWSSGREVTRTLDRLFGNRRIESFHIPFVAVATDLETGQPVALHSGSAVSAIRASLSVPGLFTPVWLEDRLLVDGGVSNPLPVDLVRSLDVDVVVAVDVLVEPSEVELGGIPAIPMRDLSLGIVRRIGSGPTDPRRYHPSVFSVLFQMSTVFQKRLCTLQLQSNPPDLLLRPDFRADPPCYSRVGCGIEAGERAMNAAMPALRDLLSR